MVVGVVWAYPVEREEERVQVEVAGIREARVAMAAPTEANVGRGVLVAGEVDFATLEHSNTVRPNCRIQDVDIHASEAERSHSVPERGQESSRGSADPVDRICHSRMQGRIP